MSNRGPDQSTIPGQSWSVPARSSYCEQAAAIKVHGILMDFALVMRPGPSSAVLIDPTATVVDSYPRSVGRYPVIVPREAAYHLREAGNRLNRAARLPLSPVMHP